MLSGYVLVDAANVDREYEKADTGPTHSFGARLDLVVGGERHEALLES